MAAIFLVTTPPEILCPLKAETPTLTPFSAVMPHRFIAVPRLKNTLIALETIHEEEINMDVSQNSSLTLLSPCFFQVKKPLSSFSRNCRCA
ncbi:Detected protein of unknown function [Hibiscus syriacus]|uniref:Uncharacterized protein n=1 Tax=Hibiscus syriacus TaxID=106335 RepID=A0A6A3CYC9_HIBSY|nr:Detected protein of unknown function [Hibiscus syriacus]